MIALRLARAGYGGGDPLKIMEWPSDVVVAALRYEDFVAKYERRFLELNRPEDR